MGIALGRSPPPRTRSRIGHNGEPPATSCSLARAIENELHALSLAYRLNPAPSVVTLLRPKGSRPRRAAKRPSTVTKAKAADRRLS